MAGFKDHYIERLTGLKDLSSDIFVFDFETTGLNIGTGPKMDRPVELAYQKYEGGKLVDEASHYLSDMKGNLDVKGNKFLESVGITPEILNTKGLNFESTIVNFAENLKAASEKGSTIVGYNARKFDITLLENTYEKITGKKLNIDASKIVDAGVLFKGLSGGLRPEPGENFVDYETRALAQRNSGWKLSNATKELGIDFDVTKAHGAAYDTKKTAEVYYKLKRLQESGRKLANEASHPVNKVAPKIVEKFPLKMSNTSMLIGGGIALLGYQALSRKSSEDQLRKMKGEREVSLLGSAAGFTMTGAALYTAAHTPFSELIEKSTIRSEKIFKSHDAAGFLEKFKTPNKFLMASTVLVGYGAGATALNLASGENMYRAPLLAATLGTAGVMAYAHYAKNDFDMDKSAHNLYKKTEEFFAAHGSVPIKGIKDWGKKTYESFEKGSLIPSDVPGSKWINGALKHMPKSHVAKLALLGGGLIASGQMMGVFDRGSDVMLPERQGGGAGQFLGYNTETARNSSSYRNSKAYTQSQRNSRNEYYQPKGASLV